MLKAGVSDGRELAPATSAPISWLLVGHVATSTCRGGWGKRFVVGLGGRENRFGRQSLLLVKDHFFFYKGYVSQFIWYLTKEKLFAPELEENRLC